MNYRFKSIEPAISVLSHHGKTFRFAGRFLDKNQLKDCARLYRFCRFLDDLVDDSTNTQAAGEELDLLRRHLELGSSSMVIVQDFIELANQYHMHLNVVFELIRGIESDLKPVLIVSEEELLRYCYRVAGTVGLLMCDVLGVHDLRAKAHAIDLGIGMQLTNIARDILEDAEMGRCYVPSQWLEEIPPKGMHKSGVMQTMPDALSVKRLLDLAEVYYESGRAGLRFLPPRARKGINIAASVYREIGIVISERGFDVFSNRAYVSFVRKIWVALNALLSDSRKKTYESHNHALHIHLKGLPHANNPNR